MQRSQIHPDDDMNSPSNPISHSEPSIEVTHPHERGLQRVSAEIARYLRKESPEFCRLSKLRQQGWANPAGDVFFSKQRRTADSADDKTARVFYNMMQGIGDEMHLLTGVFRIKHSGGPDTAILDMCMAPGGYLATALHHNPDARAVGFSLPAKQGGHNVLLPRRPNITLNFLDITMLAADMGATDTSIPAEHPDTDNFLPRQFDPADKFDLVICDGQVLRTHERAAYRERREATRLTVTQLALGLEHLKPGGSMIVLLHKVEAPDCVYLLYTFEKFASVRLFKPTRAHAKRSSFYMVATNIRSDCEEAGNAIAMWKRMWNVATFGSDEVYQEAIWDDDRPDAVSLLSEFGPRLVGLGREVWDIQSNALAKAPFIRENRPTRGGMAAGGESACS
ncbi:FtsJ-like methyltransferase family protein [Aspergillus pseudoustus]|uniref:FtsJ-like methyltransferase family protein n=1 Tax=Aspergillus pseudoustus TaxID=1810923 RepID=A0ABR4JM94_9EURO